MKGPNRTVILFAKAPVLGAVKRRLAQDIGAVAAAAFHKRTLERMQALLGNDPRWRLVLCLTPDHAALNRGAWPQGPGDLGLRMARALTRACQNGPAVLIGSDIPGISPDHIADAFAALDSHDAVFGPAADGGYWLVGFRRPPGLLHPFKGVRWSSEHALADTLANLKGRRAALIDTLRDVDEGKDFRGGNGPPPSRRCSASLRMTA